MEDYRETIWGFVENIRKSKNEKSVLNIGEIIIENDEVYVEDVTDSKQFKTIWDAFVKIYQNLILQQN